MSRRSLVIAFRALLVPLGVAGCQRERPRTGGAADSASAAAHMLGPAVGPAVAVPPAPETLAVAPPLPTAPAAVWKVYRGDGFELRYPPDASVGPATSYPEGLRGVGIHGPRISLRSPNPGIGTHTGPAYELVVSSFANTADLTVDAWVDSVRREHNARLATASDPDSLEFLAPPDTTTVAGQRALVLHPFCGDCQPEEVYVARPGRALVVSKLYDLSIPGDERAQWRLYDAILSTLRWTD